jgi:uncharacterized protein (DUF2252 family)
MLAVATSCGWVGRLAVAGVLVCACAAGPVARGEERAFDIVKNGYGQFTRDDDPYSFPMKVWALSQEQNDFWRGGRDVFFRWVKDNCADWLADKGAYVLNHGDLHLGNIGTYAKEGPLGALSFGATDFDDTAKLPFQIELLQGLISLRLTARESGIELNGARRDELARVMFDSYRNAVMSDKTTFELVSKEERIGKFIDAAQKNSYDVTLNKFTSNGKFKGVVTGKGEKARAKEILRPSMEKAEEMARCIAQGLENSPEAKARFNYADVEKIRSSIKDVALRTRLESVGSQGLKKYLVLLEKPLKGLEMDVVMYVKQEIPAAAERAGAIAHDPRSPGRRCSEDMQELINPEAYLNTWCDLGGESYWITFKEPWSEEIDITEIKDYGGLRAMAGVWGSVVGAMHRDRGHGDAIRQRLGEGLLAVLRHRSTSYMAELDRQYHDFVSDPRAKAMAAKAQVIVDAAKQEAQARAGAMRAAQAAVEP